MSQEHTDVNSQFDPPAHGLRAAYEGQKSQTFDPSAKIATPLELHRCEVKQEWVDYNMHMSESCYLLVFGDNSDAFFRYFGIDDHYRAEGHSIYTLETHMRHVREVRLGEPLRLTMRLIDWDHQRLHLFHEMYHAGNGQLLATAEQLQIHVDMRAGRAAPFPGELQQRLGLIYTTHANAPLPGGLGRAIAIRRTNTRS
jgi:acyl-CoA thioester hydrolase